MSEEWRPVLGIPFPVDYEISNLGRIRRGPNVAALRNTYAGRIVKPCIRKSGYAFVTITRPDGSQRGYRMHRLVAATFIGPQPEDKDLVRHLDGDPTNNAADNLAYGTFAENSADMMRHGRSKWANRTACDHGHEFTEANTRIASRGHRVCVTCARNAAREHARRKRAAMKGLVAA